MKQVSVIIPAYNEGRHIFQTVAALSGGPLLEEIIVIDDGSQDDTADRAAQAGARVIKLPQNIGKGGATSHGILVAAAELVLLVDGDLQESAVQVFKLLEPVQKGDADLSIARLAAEKRGNGFGLARKTAAWGIRRLTGMDIAAPLSGQRCAPRQVFLNLQPFAPRFGLEVGMIIDAIRENYRISFVDLELEHCPPGRDWLGFLHRGKQMVDICRTLVNRMGR